MNYSRILEHAFEVTARHRALWVLGFLWALVGGCGGGGGGGVNFSSGSRSSRVGNGDVPEALRPMADRLAQVSPEQWIGFAVGAVCVLFVLAIVFTAVRYALQTAVLRSLDHLDAEGTEPTVRRAWREGWHRRTWRPFLQNVAVDIVTFVLVVVAMLPAALPVFFAIASADHDGLGGAGAMALLGVGCYCCLWLAAVFVLASVVSVLKQLWWRYALLDDYDFIKSMELGWSLARANARTLVGMWFVMLVVGFVWFLISVGLVIGFGLITALVAGGPAWLLYRATEGLAWPLVWGIPAGLLTMVVPLVFASGLYLVFQASVWTQVFRQLAGPPRTSLQAPVEEDSVAPEPEA